MKDKESVYDEKIFPLMKEIIDICKANDIPFFATFQYKDDSFCTSYNLSGHPALEFYEALHQSISDSGVNIDKFLRWVCREATKNGHSSMYLNQLGVPHAPPG